MEWHLRTVGAGLNYPYELLAKDYSRTTFSSGRLSLIDGRIQFRIWQKQDVDAWSKVAIRFIDECVMVGAVDIDASEYADHTEEFTAHQWQPPKWHWVDPDKEVKAERNAIEGGLGTKSESLGSRGLDYDEIQEQRLKEKLDEVEIEAKVAERRRSLGLPEDDGGGESQPPQQKKPREPKKAARKAVVDTSPRRYRGLPVIPSASRQAFNFTVASIRHVMGGMPTRSQQEIDAIMATCRACELFVPRQDDPELGVCGHKKCGCTLTQQRRFISKVGWRSQHCPIEKW